MLLLKIFKYWVHILVHAEKNRVKRLKEDESHENDCLELQEGLNRGITVEGEYFPNYEAVEEKYALVCKEIANIIKMCKKEDIECSVSDEEDLDDIAKEDIRMSLKQTHQTYEWNQD